MINEALEYVKNYFRENDPVEYNMPVKFPFRSRLEHTLRVYKWAHRINIVERGDWEIIALAVLFHDTGKVLDDFRPHAELSAEICEKYLNTVNYPARKKQKVLKAINCHSSKSIPKKELTIEERIIIDADLLDETGALTVVWNAMAVGIEENPSYIKVHQKNVDYFTELLQYKNLFKTAYGKKLYNKRLKFLQKFNINLAYELGMDL